MSHQITWAEHQSSRVDFRESKSLLLKGLGWLGGRDSNPDTVVQRAVNGLRSVPVRSVLFEFSALPLQCAPLRSALFTHKMSHCVSGAPKSRPQETQLLAVRNNQVSDGLRTADLPTGLAGRSRRPLQATVRALFRTRSLTSSLVGCPVVFSSSKPASCIGSKFTPLRVRTSSVIANA